MHLILSSREAEASFLLVRRLSLTSHIGTISVIDTAGLIFLPI
jgi:hypothetical protein